MFDFLLDKYKDLGADPFSPSNKKVSDMINLAIGDPDIETAPIIIEKTYEDMKRGYTHYTLPNGQLELKEEIVKFLHEEYNQNFKTNQILITSSATEAMFVTLSAVCEKGDEVILLEPYFASYKTQIELTGATPKYAKLSMENGFQITEEALEKAITKNTKAIIFNTPNNPTGVCYNEESYQVICKIAHKYHILIIADDIYTIYSYGEKFRPLSSYPDMEDYVVTIRSFSKNCAMTGFRLGYIVGNQEFINACGKINEVVCYSAPTPSQRAAIYALRYRKTYQSEFSAKFKERLAYAYQRVCENPLLSAIEPKGTFYMAINVSKTGMDGLEFTKYAEEKLHVKVIPGILFGDSVKDFIRICATVSIDKLKETFDRFEKIEAKNRG